MHLSSFSISGRMSTTMKVAFLSLVLAAAGCNAQAPNGTAPADPDPTLGTTATYGFSLNLKLATPPTGCGDLGAAGGITLSLEEQIKAAASTSAIFGKADGATGVGVQVTVLRESNTITTVGPAQINPGFLSEEEKATAPKGSCELFEQDTRSGTDSATGAPYAGTAELVDLNEATVPEGNDALLWPIAIACKAGWLSAKCASSRGAAMLITGGSNYAKAAIGITDWYGKVNDLFSDWQFKLSYWQYKVPNNHNSQNAPRDLATARLTLTP